MFVGKENGLVKTVKFSNPKYVGDPINAVRIFNEKQVDELIILDIDATSNKRVPNFKMIEDLAGECRMPLCYGGGVNSVEQIQKILSLGVEKVAISSAALENPDFIPTAANCVGNQSVVVVLDVKKCQNSSHYEIWTHNGKNNTKKCPIDFARKSANLGAGEIVINSIDNDGLMKGYDLNLAEKIRDSMSAPLTLLGGAGSLQDIGQLIQRFGIIGAAAGSLFVFKGAYRAVLINYPNDDEKEKFFEANYK